MDAIIQTTQAKPVFNWVRSKDGLIFGVCEAIARQMAVQTWIVRILWLLSVLALGCGFFFYFMLAICLPREDKVAHAARPRVFGVCYKLGLAFNSDLGVIRVIALALLLSSLGTTFIVYAVLALLLPSNPADIRIKAVTAS